MDMGNITSHLSSSSVSVTCFDESLNCLVLIHFRTNPDLVRVGHINDTSADRAIVIKLSSMEMADTPIVAVYTWNSTGSIFSGQLSHVSQPLASTSEFLFCINDAMDMLAFMQQVLWIPPLPVMDLMTPENISLDG